MISNPMTRMSTAAKMVIASLLCFAVLGALPPPGLSANEPTSDAEIAKLIEDLGADSYFTRTRATERLQHLGLEAFDDLHGAQFHPDNEIAMAARFLVSSLLVSWSKDSDPPEVQEALSEYGAQDELERSSRIDMLSELPDRSGLLALVRLARFETSLRLSRLAALAAMRQTMVGDQAQRRRSAEQIQQTLGDSTRQSAEWLRIYSEDLLTGSYSIDGWRELIAKQRQQVDAAASDASNRESVLELVRVCASRAAMADMKDEAVNLAVENIDLIPPTTRDLVEACGWAIDNELHPFVLQLKQQHERMFDQHPVLLYGAAESQIASGNDGEADRLAEQASKIRPLPMDDQARSKLQPKEIEEIAQTHRMIAGNLRDRGLFHWAEREYRLVIDSMNIDDGPSAAARGKLAEMFGEMEKHQEAVDVLNPLVERAEKDAKLQQKLNNMLFNLSRAKSDVLFHNAKLLVQKGDIAAARPMMMEAYDRYQINIDILIAMYRLEGDEEWNRAVKQRLDVSTRQSELMIQQARLRAKQFGRTFDEQVADAYNQYAWLVANTQGEYQRALDYSLKSLEVRTESESTGARLDTCARCYFAVGDIDKAILTQKRAIKLLPHSPPLKRQLKEFEEAKRKEQNDVE